MKRTFRKRSGQAKKTETVRTPTSASHSTPATKHVSRKRAVTRKRSLPRTEDQYHAQPERLKQTWDRVLAVISKMRTDKVSLAQASRDVGIGPRTVKRWGGSALRKGQGGRYVAKKSDTLLRLMIILTPEGPREITVRGSKQATLLAEYWNALHRYVETGDAARLNAFRGKHITDANGVDVSLLTDFPVLNRLASAGVLSFESLYARTT
jgi:predicted component of type VI protein secretion system